MKHRAEPVLWWIQDHLRLIIILAAAVLVVTVGFFIWNSMSGSDEPVPVATPVLKENDPVRVSLSYTDASLECQGAIDQVVSGYTWTTLIPALQSWEATCQDLGVAPEDYRKAIDLQVERIGSLF